MMLMPDKTWQRITVTGILLSVIMCCNISTFHLVVKSFIEIVKYLYIPSVKCFLSGWLSQDSLEIFSAVNGSEGKVETIPMDLNFVKIHKLCGSLILFVVMFPEEIAEEIKVILTGKQRVNHCQNTEKLVKMPSF